MQTASQIQESFFDFKDQVSQLLLDGEFLEAKRLIENQSTTSDDEKRVLGHLEGKLLMHQGEHSKAADLLHSTIDQYGENVSLVADLTSCYYLQGKIKKWQSSVKQLRETILELEPILDKKQLIKLSLLLGKFLEEDGQLGDAFTLYSSCLEKLNKDSDQYLIDLCLIQLLRVQSLLGIKDGLAETYNTLIAINEETGNHDINIEAQHSLMLAEFNLFGLFNAQARMMKLLSSPKVSQSDKHLVLYDFMEEALIQRVEISQLDWKQWVDFDALNSFEKEIHSIVFVGEIKNFMELLPLESSLSLANYLRILGVYLIKLSQNADSNQDYARELKKKYNFLISNLDQKSLQYWSRRIQGTHSTVEENQIAFCPNKRTLFFRNESLSLPQKKGVWEFFDIVRDKASIPVEEVIKTLWGVDYDPSYYRRLRTLIHRLNDDLLALTSTRKIVLINKHSVQLKEGFKITSK